MTGLPLDEAERVRILEALFDGPEDRETKLRLNWVISYRRLVEIIEGPSAVRPLSSDAAPVEWPVGQLAEIEADGLRVRAQLREDPDHDVAWWSLDEDAGVYDLHEVTAVRPLRPVPQGALVAASEDMITGLCHWEQDRGDARQQDHWKFHFGSPCPYRVVAAVLAGRKDQRDIVRNWPGKPDQSPLPSRDVLADLRARVLAIPAGSYEGDPGFSVAISRVLQVLYEAGSAKANSTPTDRNPFLPERPADGQHSFHGPADIGGNSRCRFCGAYQGSDEAQRPCEGEFKESGKMRSWARRKWEEQRTETAAAPSSGTGTPAEAVSGGSGDAEWQEPGKPWSEMTDRERLWSSSRTAATNRRSPRSRERKPRLRGQHHRVVSRQSRPASC